MTLGEKLRQARQEAGLSQRQLCGEEITRNMLSQIEHGTARPSMATLKFLADRLGKPVSYFLEEEAKISPNQAAMERARSSFDAGDYGAAAEALKDFREPDPVYGREKQLLAALSGLGMAEMAIGENKEIYARELLENVEIPLYLPELERRRLLLLARLKATDLLRLCEKLPSLDEELLLRAEAALEWGEAERCLWLLGAAEDQTGPRWNLLRGELHLRQGEYDRAANCLRLAEEGYPEEVIPKLEQCYRELEDFKMAYFYACKQKR